MFEPCLISWLQNDCLDEGDVPWTVCTLQVTIKKICWTVVLLKTYLVPCSAHFVKYISVLNTSCIKTRAFILLCCTITGWKKSASCGFQICAYLSEWESLQNFFGDRARSSFGRVVVSGFCCPVLFVDIYSTSTEFKLSKIRNISLWPYSFYRLSYNLQKKVILIRLSNKETEDLWKQATTK